MARERHWKVREIILRLRCVDDLVDNVFLLSRFRGASGGPWTTSCLLLVSARVESPSRAFLTWSLLHPSPEHIILSRYLLCTLHYLSVPSSRALRPSKYVLRTLAFFPLFFHLRHIFHERDTTKRTLPRIFNLSLLDFPFHKPTFIGTACPFSCAPITNRNAHLGLHGRLVCLLFSFQPFVFS